MFNDWPLVLIDLSYATRGIVGRSYLEPYLKHSARYIVPAIRDLVSGARGHAHPRRSKISRPREDRSNLVGYEGIAMIAIAGPGHGGMGCARRRPPTCRSRCFSAARIGGVPAYNSNGLWLTDVATLAARGQRSSSAEGAFKGLKLRLGRERLADDLRGHTRRARRGRRRHEAHGAISTRA